MSDTIAAIATPAGRGGVGIVRVSGPHAKDICSHLINLNPRPRFAHYTPFLNSDQSIIDEGLALFFAGPKSFTGEDVAEFHGHGGPVVLDMLLRRVLQLGARLARPGEFSERAFLNNKMDLVQAEAVAQLINADSEQSAVAAMRSLQGEFSQKIDHLVEALIRLRLYVEAAIDFPDEEIDFLADEKVVASINTILNDLDAISTQAKQGALLNEGINIAIVGRPNAGKSTLLNRLTGQDTAIVSPIAGTTRDIVKDRINIDGLLINIVDTAGLRETEDQIEQAGIQRTLHAASLADVILFVIDATVQQPNDPWSIYPGLKEKLPNNVKAIVVLNKIDQLSKTPYVQHSTDHTLVALSAHNGEGIDNLRAQIKHVVGLNQGADNSAFLARRRHLDALARAKQHVVCGQNQLLTNAAGELLAEELKQAQLALSEITGTFSSDDLLGRIFSEFCIGK